MRPRQRRLLAIAAGIVGVPLLALLLALGVAQTPPGKRLLAGMIEDIASSSDHKVRLTGLSGFVPFDIGVERLEIADRDGVWLTASEVTLDWSPLAMLRDHLKIERLHAKAVNVERQPVASEQPERKKADAGSGLPQRIDIGAVEVANLNFAAAIAGEPSLWRLAGNARVAGLKENNWLIVKAERSDGGEGLLDLNGSYDGTKEILSIKLVAREGAATVNRFARLDVKQGIDMRADITGPLTDLNGVLTIKAGDLLSVDGKVRAERQGAVTQATLSLTGRAGKLGDAAWVDAVQGDWSLQAKGTFEADAIVLQQADLQAPAGRLSGSGRIDRRDDTGDLTFTIDAASAAFAKLLPEISWRNLTAKGRLSGKLMHPAMAAIVSGEGLKIGEVAIARATATLDGVAQPDDTRTAKLTAELEEIVLPAANGRSLTTRATIIASAMQKRDQPIAIRDFKLVSPVVTADGSGQYDPDSNLMSGTVKAAVADLAVFAEALNQDIAGKLDLTWEAKESGGGLTLALDGTLENGRLPQVPQKLLAPKLTASLRGSIAPQQVWRVQSLKLESGAGALTAQGQGKGRLGDAKLDWKLLDLAAVDPRLAGTSEGTIELSETAEALNAKLRGKLAAAKIGAAEVPRLAIELDAKRANGETAGTLAVDGEMQKAPIKGGGDFAVTDDGRALVRKFDLRWASLSIIGNEFTVAASGATGDVAIKMERLQELNPFLTQRLAGSLDATIKAVAANKLKIAGSLRNFRLDNEIAVDRAQIDGEITDPLGQAAFTLTATASGPQLAGPLRQITVKANGEKAAFSFNVDGTGDKLRATAQGKAAIGEAETAIDLQTLNAVYAGQTIALAAPSRVKITGDTTTVERLALRAGNGTVSASGILGPNSKLDVQGRALPLSLLRAIDPTTQIFGVANFTAAVRGALSNPEVDLTVDASDMRLRTIRTAGIPPGALNAKIALRNNNATIEGRFTAGPTNTLNFSGVGPLPGADGVTDGRLRIEGGMNLAQLTPFLSGNGRLSGALKVDLTFTATGGAIGGNGAITIADGRYFNLAEGLAIRDINATFGVVGDRLEIRQFTARPRGDGEISASGFVQVDPQLTLPVDVTIVAKSARILDRRDMQATVSSNLRLQGSVAQGMTLAGTATVERAEINLDANVNQGPEIAVLPVREINRPGGAADDKPRKPTPPGPETRLQIKINAPQSVFVRGRGLDVEMGGALDVGGTISRPQILGALQLRRGSFSGVGRRLEFTRGTVSFPDPESIEPVIDFTASTRIESGTAEIVIAGRPSAPKVTMTSSPSLPQDEIMAQLLFGRSTSALSPLQMAEIGQSVGTLSGLTGSGGGILDRLRKALGFDRLGVSSDPDAVAAGSSSVGGSSLEVGRNVAPGVYLGAKQGAQSGSSTAVVEIELTPHIKVESEIGVDARSKVGVSVEWDY